MYIQGVVLHVVLSTLVNFIQNLRIKIKVYIKIKV